MHNRPRLVGPHFSLGSTHGQEAGRCCRQDPDPRRAGLACAARRYRARSARCRDHGLLQGLQREDRDKRGQIVPVEITIYEDRSFSFILKTPPTPFLIRQAAGLETAANNPGREVAGTITKAQVEEIANTKMPDLNAIDLEGAMLQVEGTARSMGIKVV